MQLKNYKIKARYVSLYGGTSSDRECQVQARHEGEAQRMLADQEYMIQILSCEEITP